LTLYAHFASNLSIKSNRLNQTNFRSWLEDIMSEMEEDSRAMVFTVARNIWYGRNQYVLQNRRLDFRQILAKANQNLPLCLMRDVPNAHSQRVPVGWKPPPEGTFKVKLNAAIRNNQGTCMGFIDRDHEGNVLAASSRSISSTGFC